MWAICNNLRYNFRDNNFKIEYLNKWTDIYERVKVELFLCVFDNCLSFYISYLLGSDLIYILALS